MGTPQYAAPEQIKAETVDSQSDVYSVAATLYFLLVGRAPFEGADPVPTMAAIVSESPSSLRKLQARLSPKLDRVVLRGLDRDRKRRWQNVDEFRQALMEQVRANLEGAKYTLAVPDYLYQKGLHDFADIAKFKDQLDGKIYGIEPGNDGNRHVLDMIQQDAFGLAGFDLVESSEQGMLAEVARKVPAKQPVVFLGWEPHPMNTKFKLDYLTGGDKYFGPNFGGATIYTVVAKGYPEKCPNIGQLLKNLSFTLPMENQLMGQITDEGKEPADAATEYLKANPAVVEPWLKGVTTVDGKDGLAAVKQKLGL